MRLPYAFARSNGVLLQQEAPDGLHVALHPNAQLTALSELRRVSGKPLFVSDLDAEAFDAALAAHYTGQGEYEELADEVWSGDLSSLMQDSRRVRDLLEGDDDAPLIRMINVVLTQALRDGASDVHIEPYADHSSIRFRLDGQLREITRPPRNLHAALVSRIKVMADLDIAEKRLPQDGRIALRIGGRPVDVRVSVLPTGQGERAVLRLLSKDAERIDLDRLGLEAGLRAQLDHLIRMPHGILLVTGPTGSGKTTTLYAALTRLDRQRINIATVEDPIEYELDSISQTQVNNKIGMDFPAALRALLRQDPDVILIGEIRDQETAQIAVQASLTGHLVMATLHTNDAVSAVTRLHDIGIEPYLLGSSLLGVLAQRLVRRLCPECREAYTPSAAEWAVVAAGPAPETIYRAVGCPSCNGAGYRGRTGIFELLTVDAEARRLIHDRAGEPALRAWFAKQGAVTLRHDGVRWIERGDTTIEELLRAAREDA